MASQTCLAEQLACGSYKIAGSNANSCEKKCKPYCDDNESRWLCVSKTAIVQGEIVK